ncbi:DUF3515 domain-containing protein [Streptomyces sp. NPDC001380]|uniref:DUF3515 domain-containing protein n=1 Tax=Streptomyces sp. NPDC001380 TaxID=3364566 RepID=UPI00368D2150
MTVPTPLRRLLPASAAPRRMLLLTAVLCALLAAGLLWWRGGADRVEPPRPDAGGAALCRALDRALPRDLQGRARRDPAPASPYTAAWASSPRAVLECGVPVPPRLERPRPSDEAAEVNGVDWLVEELGGGDYRFTTIERRTTVQVTVRAGAYPNATDVLPPLSDAVARTVPSRFTP